MPIDESERIFVIAPYGRDAEAVKTMLERNAIEASCFPDLASACEEAKRGVALIVVAEESLRPDQVGVLTAFLDQQPPWSDLPITVLSHRRDGFHVTLTRALSRFNVTLLERPLYVRTFVAAAKVALRARRRQYEVRSLLDRAESASRAKDEFVAILGHELRNPLSPIVAALHLIRTRDDGTLNRELTIVERQVSHLTRLVDDLLDVSRIAQGKVEVRQDRIDVAEIVTRAVEMTSPIFEHHHHRLSVSVAPNLVVRGDSTRLAQVVANLLTNAAKYTPEGGDVTIDARADDGDVLVRVTDNGIGIAPVMLPRVFELFAQESQATDRATGGLGLGLAIVRSLVGLHGGTVLAESRGIGAGSSFSFRLPRLDEAAAPSDRKPALHWARPSTPGKPLLRVLVVDDNEDAADMLALIFEQNGFDTRIAHDGADALRIAGDFVPNLAIVDIGLPVMDGYELAHRLKHSPELKDVRLIALTGYGQSEDIRRSREAGFDEHFVKPVDLDRLQVAMTRLLA